MIFYSEALGTYCAKVAVVLRYKQLDAVALAGATLDVQHDEVHLNFSIPISGLSANNLRAALESFFKTAQKANEQLEMVKSKEW